MAGSGVALPALVAGAGAASETWRRKPPARRSGWGAAAGAGLGFALAFVCVRGWPAFPPRDTLQWLPLAALLAAGIGLVNALGRPSLAWKRGLLGALALAMLGAELLPQYRYQWTFSAGAVWTAALWLGVAFFALTLEKLLGLLTSRWGAFCLLALGFLASVTLAVSSSAALAQVAGIFTATVGAIWLWTWLRPGFDWRSGVQPIASVLLPSLLLNGFFYAELRPVPALLIALAPGLGCIAALAATKLWREMSGGWLVALSMILAGLAAAAVAAMTVAPGGFE